MTHAEYCQKYRAAANEVRQMLQPTNDVEFDWDLHTKDSAYYTVLVWTPEGREKGQNIQVYDRKDSPLDREAYGPTTTETWVVLMDNGEEVTDSTLSGAVRAAIAKGWVN